MTILIDKLNGSYFLANHEPLRSMLDPCDDCAGHGCRECRDTGRSLCSLDSADVCFNGRSHDGPFSIGIEVKSLDDLLASLRCGRFQATQAPAMLAEYDMRWLLYYGVHRSGKNGRLEEYREITVKGEDGNGRDGKRQKVWRWCPSQVDKQDVPFGYLRAATMEIAASGFSVDHVNDVAEAASWIGSLYRLWTKDLGDHHLFRTFDNSFSLPVRIDPPLPPKVEIAAQMASKLPGIRYEKALAAAWHFGSARRMLNATPDEWAEVPVKSRKSGGRTVRIGKVIGKAIEELVS